MVGRADCILVMYLSVYLSVCLFICLLICLSVCLSVFACRLCIGAAPALPIPFVWNKPFCNSACLFIYLFLPHCFCDDVTLRWCPENPYLKSASVSHEKELYDYITQGIKQGVYLLWLGILMHIFLFPGSCAGVSSFSVWILETQTWHALPWGQMWQQGKLESRIKEPEK